MTIPAGVAAPAGRLIATAIGAIGLLRGPRPIHTTGLRLDGTLQRTGRAAARSGIAWIDDGEAGETAVAARFSRGAGLPALVPDVLGLAVRLGVDEGDLLLSTTGIGVPGRFLLRPRRTPSRAVLSTLMPYRGDHGPVLVAARTTSPTVLPARMEDLRAVLAGTPWTLDLLFASPTGRWHRFGRLSLRSATGPIDAAAPRFDPVLRAPRGAGTYGWTRALREPSYAVGRRSRASRRAG